jgi:hypothetical protein
VPSSQYGQLITFAVEQDDDKRFAKWRWATVRRGETVQSIASRLGHPEDARRIADENDVRSVRKVLKHHPHKPKDRQRIKVPGGTGDDQQFHVLAGDQPPRITEGYAKFSVIDRPGGTGILSHDGYDPIAMEVPIRFLAKVSGDGEQVEQDIELLERMAGRGNFQGTASGPPPIIRISTTNANGGIVPLVPRNYQWSRQNPSAPLWFVTGIDWDADPRRGGRGNRLEQKATVTVQQHTTVSLQMRSATARSKGRGGR